MRTSNYFFLPDVSYIQNECKRLNTSISLIYVHFVLKKKSTKNLFLFNSRYTAKVHCSNL